MKFLGEDLFDSQRIDWNKQNEYRILARDILEVLKDRKVCLYDFQQAAKFCEDVLSVMPVTVDDADIVYRIP